VKFPRLPGVADPRQITGPARLIAGKVVPLPYLVPQVDADGNDLAGFAIPNWPCRWQPRPAGTSVLNRLGILAIFTSSSGRTFPSPPRALVVRRLAIPGRRSKSAIAEWTAILQRVQGAAQELIRNRYMLQEDLDGVIARAKSHWAFAMDSVGSATGK